MERTPKKIEHCTATELREYATVVMQIEIPQTCTGPQIIGKMRNAGFDGDEISVPSGNPSGPAPVQSQPSAAAAPVGSHVRQINGRTHYRIMIPTQDKPGGDQPVFVSVNGRAMFIPRAEPQWVPAEYVEALKNAEEFHYDNRPDGLGLTKPRVVKSYPYQMVG